MLDPWLQYQLARLNLTPRALGAGRARRAIPTREAHDGGLRFGDVRVDQPREALLTGRASGSPRLPIKYEVGLGKARTSLGLPARIVGNRANDGDPVVALAVHKHVRVGVTLVDQVFSGQPTGSRE